MPLWSACLIVSWAAGACSSAPSSLGECLTAVDEMGGPGVATCIEVRAEPWKRTGPDRKMMRERIGSTGFRMVMWT